MAGDNGRTTMRPGPLNPSNDRSRDDESSHFNPTDT